MKKFFTLFLMLATLATFGQSNLVLTAVYDADLSGGVPKGVELHATSDINDLSNYGLGSANNGGGTDGEEFTFPAVAVTEGTYLYVTTDSAAFHDFFGFAADYHNVSAMGINGDDAVELFHNGSVADVYGDINTDGSGEPWEYANSWAYRMNGTGPDGNSWTIGNWNIPGPDALDGETTNATAINPVPVGTYSASLPTEVNVTFQVDMNNETVSANGVHLAGEFQGWNPGSTEMTDGNNDGIYTFDTMLTVGDTLEFKYVNGDDWPGAEGVPSACELPGTGNRYVIVPAAVHTLDPVCYGSCAPCGNQVEVTIQVDMSNETVDPAGVYVAGGFQGWDPTSTQMNAVGNGIYEHTTQVDPNSSFEYKFLNGSGWGNDESVPAACAVNSNRQETIGQNDTTVGPYVFGSCDITDLTPDFIDLATLKQDSANGLPMYPDTSGWIKGVAFTPDFDGNSGYSFFIHDNGTGINIWNNSDVDGYQVQMGDSLHIHGSMAFFNGLSEWRPDSIVVVSQGNDLPDPSVVSILNESTESQFIRINDVTLVDPSQWPTSAGNSASVDIETAGGDTLLIRIDQDTDIDGNVPAPMGTFSVVGAGSQFDDFNAPFDHGYQILPRMQSDIIMAPEKEFIDIATLKQDSANGLPMYPDTSGWIKGVAFTPDFDGNSGYSFFIHDNGTGINIWNNSDVDGYQVQMGDSLHIHGSMAFFNGLSEWRPDSIVVVSQGNDLPDPSVVSMLNEGTESQFIRINDVTLVDPSQWPTSAGNSASVDIETAGGDTLLIRIDQDTDIDGNVPAPMGTFSVVGAGSQFDDFNAPFDHGYQILPRMQSDIITAPSDTPSVYFTQGNFVVNEGDGTAELTVGISNPNSDTTMVDVVLTGGTATQGNDYNFTSPVTVVFLPDSGGTKTVSVDLIDDTEEESDETIAFELQNPTNNTKITTANATITIEDNDETIPVYNIDEINGVDANGEGDSVGVVCELRGVVTTINYNDDLQFWMQDRTAGINVFSFDPLPSYPNVTMGDSIHVIGEIAMYRGLLEIIPDSIALISQGNDLPEPQSVDSLTEETESELLVLNGVEVLDSIPTGGGYNMEAYFNGDTIIIRIDDATDVYNMPMPTGYFNITGVGSQFASFNPPYEGGYQLQVRSIDDFEELLAPTADFSYSADELEVVFTDESTNDPTSWKWYFGDGDSSDMQNPTHNYTEEGTYEVCLIASNMVGSDETCDSVTVTSIGIADINKQVGLDIFPVPTANQLNISAEVNMEAIELVDAAGKVVLRKNINKLETTVDMRSFADGLYIVKIVTKDGIAAKSVLKQ